MTEDVKPDVIKKTQDSLGKYFKKPPLTEKLLKKPPFRFLHDIISVVIKETGFLEGLFSSDELIADNIKDKDAKLVYLTKLVDVMKLITGNNLTVRPSKIIAGHEPTKTNELLQAIGRALDKKISSAEAIEHYKNSKKKSRTTGRAKPTSKDETKAPPSRQSSQSRKPVEKEKSTTSDRKKGSPVVSKPSAKEGKVRSEERRERKREDEKENKEREREKVVLPVEEPSVVEIARVESTEENPSSSQRPRQSSAKPKGDSAASSSSEMLKHKSALSDTTNSPKREAELVSGDTRQISTPQVSEIESKSSAESKSKIIPESATGRRVSRSEVDSGKTNENGPAPSDRESKRKSSAVHKSKEATEPLSPTRIKKPEVASNKMERRHTFENPGSPPPKVSNDPIVSTNRASAMSGNPKTSLRATSARPSSARPAAPRIRSKAEYIFNEDISTPMGTVNVIVENFDMEDDDIDNMVVIEAVGSGDPASIDGIPRVESQISKEHGHLVAQILETQRELTNTDNVDVMPKKVEIIREWDVGSKRDRETTIKEVDRLRGSIQTLTRATNPLGKLFDYLQEDVEMMQKELQEWRSQYNQLSEQLQREHALTQQTIEPMKETLKTIESNITVQLDQICQVKAAMMKNDQKILRLLNGC